MNVQPGRSHIHTQRLAWKMKWKQHGHPPSDQEQRQGQGPSLLQGPGGSIEESMGSWHDMNSQKNPSVSFKPVLLIIPGTFWGEKKKIGGTRSPDDSGHVKEEL